MPDAVELREFLEKVMNRHFEYHPDEFDDEYAKFTQAAPESAEPSTFDAPPPPPPPPPVPQSSSDTSSSVSTPSSVNG